jgi:hypothetical protein
MTGTPRHILSVLALFASLVCSATCFAAPPSAAENPFAAHNAYPWRLYPKDRFDRALNSGLKHLEVDVTYDPMRKAAIATHDAEPTGKESELGALLTPLWKKWGAAPDDGYTLIIDFKSASPELVSAVATVLASQRKLLSSAPKANPANFQPGKITVCLSGTGAAHRVYLDSVPSAGELIAFSDDTGCPGSWQEDPAAYAPQQPVGFVRFISLEKQNFMDAPRSRGDDHISVERMRQAIAAADAGGYRLRIYTVNPGRRTGGDGWNTAYWDACVAAGVHMIATDAYDVARDYWQKHVETSN